MKKLRIAVLLVTVISLTGLFLACPTESKGTVTPPDPDKVPALGDYIITGDRNTVFNDQPKSLSVAPAKEGISPGKATVLYDDSKDPPSAIGTYAISIDVEPAKGWIGIQIPAGKLIIGDGGKGFPTSALYATTGLPQTIVQGSGPSPAITITPRSTAPAGLPQATNIKYTKADNPAVTLNHPLTAEITNTAQIGYYKVTFDVPGSTDWNEATALEASGSVLIELKPNDTDPTKVTETQPSDFVVQVGGGAVPVLTHPVLTATDEIKVTYSAEKLPVKLLNKDGITNLPYPIIAEGLEANTTIQYWLEDVMMDAPLGAGTYEIRITLDPVVQVAAKKAWDGLELTFKLIVDKRKPTVDDFVIGDLYRTQSAAGSFLGNNIAPKDIDISPLPKFASSLDVGADPDVHTIVKIYYDGTLSDIPQGAGEYAVTFEVIVQKSNLNWISTTDKLDGGKMKLLPLQPIIPDISYKFWFDDGLYQPKIKQLPINPGQTATCEFVPGPGGMAAFEFVKWYEDGKEIVNAGQSYSFVKTAVGWHDVTLVVKTKDKYDTDGEIEVAGKYYSETVQVRVQNNNQQ